MLQCAADSPIISAKQITNPISILWIRKKPVPSYHILQIRQQICCTWPSKCLKYYLVERMIL